MNAAAVTFSHETWGRCAAHIGMFARAGDAGTRARGFFVLLIVLLFAINGLNVVNSYVGRDFMTALADRDRAEFARQAVLWVLVFAACTAVTVVSRYVEESLGLLWRNWSTRRMLSGYMAGGIYHRLAASGDIENPDQRIADDIRTFTVTMLSFFLMLLNGTLTAIAFSGVLWSISPLLLAVGVAYAAVGSFLTFRLGRPLIRLNFQQLDKEARFRGALVHVKDNAHLIALSQRESYLYSRLVRHLTDLTGNFARIVRVNRNVGFFTTGYNWLIQLIPAVIVAPLYMDERLGFGVVTQAVVAFTHLVGAFSLVVTQFQSISSFAAVISRVDSMAAAIDGGAGTAGGPSIEVAEDGGQVAYEHVTLHAGERRRPLISDLTLVLRPGQRVLVVGGDESARTALFRATAGLWRGGEGRIVRPGAEHIMFLTERPYLPPGSLNDLLLRPRTADCAAWLTSCTERRRAPVSGAGQRLPASRRDEVLGLPGIAQLMERIATLDNGREWQSELSLGEQQLLLCARLLLARPFFAFMERPSTTLDERTLTEILQALHARRIGYVVLEEHAAEFAAYDVVLQLDPGGTWHARPVAPGTIA